MMSPGELPGMNPPKHLLMGGLSPAQMVPPRSSLRHPPASTSLNSLLFQVKGQKDFYCQPWHQISVRTVANKPGSFFTRG